MVLCESLEITAFPSSLVLSKTYHRGPAAGFLILARPRLGVARPRRARSSAPSVERGEAVRHVEPRQIAAAAHPWPDRPAVRAGRAADVAVEQRAERAEAGEAHRQACLGDAVTQGEALAGPIEADAGDIVVRRHAEGAA